MSDGHAAAPTPLALEMHDTQAPVSDEDDMPSEVVVSAAQPTPPPIDCTVAAACQPQPHAQPDRRPTPPESADTPLPTTADAQLIKNTNVAAPTENQPQHSKQQQETIDGAHQHDVTPPAEATTVLDPVHTAMDTTRAITPVVDTPELAVAAAPHGAGTTTTVPIGASKTMELPDAPPCAAANTEQDDDMQALEALMQLRETPPAPSPMPGGRMAPPARGATVARMPPPPPLTHPIVQPYGMHSGGGY